MKKDETDLTENQLNSWQPRRPASGLKHRLFPGARQTAVTARWLWGALTPTMACLMLTMVMLNSSNTGIHPIPALPMILSNVDGVFSADDGIQGGENQLASVTFDWTNHTVFKSSIRFTPTTNLSN
jgi:hypothetical protein